MKKKAAQEEDNRTPDAGDAKPATDLSFLMPNPKLAQLRALESEDERPQRGGFSSNYLPSARSNYISSGIELAEIRVNPYRLYYPGQTYTPEDFNPETVKVNPHASHKINKTRPDPVEIEKALDWRNLRLLDSFINTTGRIASRRNTRLPARLQRKVQKQIKIARCMGLLSYTGKLPEFQKRANPFTPV